MKVTILEKKDGLLEIEFEDKVLPQALLSVLMKNKVDAYTFEPHPLLPGYRLHIEADKPEKELEKAIKTVEEDWEKFGKELRSKIKPSGKEKKARKK